MTGRILPAGDYGFGDLRIGDQIVTGQEQVTGAMIDRFAELTGDRFAIHLNDAAAQAMGFPARVAHGLLVLSLIDGLKNRAPAQIRAVASLRWEWRFSQPVLLGDTVGATLTLLAMRETRRPDRGILELEVKAMNQRDEVVQLGRNHLMVQRDS